MQGSYNPDQAAEILQSHAIVAEGLTSLHARLGIEWERSLNIVQDEIQDPIFARVLLVGELLRGILSDERRPVSTTTFLISPRLRNALGVAYTIGQTIAPMTLAQPSGRFGGLFRRKLPRFSLRAKEAILRCEMAHASSQNRSRMLPLANPPPAQELVPNRR